MTNPLLEKFYELHPEKKEEEKPVLELPEEKEYKKKTVEELKQEIKDTIEKKKPKSILPSNDEWATWIDVYRNVTFKKPEKIEESDTITITTKYPTPTRVNDLSNTHKMNYQFLEMAERIKTQVATVTNVEMHTDHYSNQTKYIFEVVQNGRSYPF